MKKKWKKHEDITMPEKINPILGPKHTPKGDIKTLHDHTCALQSDVATARNVKGEFNIEGFNLANFLKNLSLILSEVANFLPSFIPPSVVASEPKPEPKPFEVPKV
jgi:hypothetical protein